MITAAQLRAARGLLGIDQKTLAQISNVSLPTIQRMEASDGNVRGNIDTLTKVLTALELAGVELIGEYTAAKAKVVASAYAKRPLTWIHHTPT